MVKLLIYALLAYVAFHFVRRFLAGLGAPGGAERRPDERRQADPRPDNRQGDPARSGEPPRMVAQDLVQCPVCGHYVAARCSRTNCPQ
ncbi:hypothetical protein GCM10011611_35610 [Aliidongia dinghuensis]|uniref:Uncharacterized protein n=1 Tax=Aliidongia dinghuensis TaxID=1867774 RepID=A0A8J2YWM5_9PROT|nr:hypothetical protein [Aliidongia dinghuensis]GGF26450.1 hypothetical protein GCM10011611_35610 [Aliidongia dinghuensis]